VSTGTVAHDLNRWWARMRGREDPTLRVTHSNDRAHAAQKDEEFVWALKDINFEVKRGEVLGIIGRNGAGKSTLLKILSRVTAPTTGEIRIGGRIASLLEVGTGFHPELTGRENIFLNGAILGMTQAEIRGKLDEIVEFSGCARYLDTPVKRYSSGMVVRLGFAVAAHLEPDILIVDEVLAVGDADFQKKCIGKMQDVASHGRTVLFVSHNMSAVERLCTSAFVLDRGLIGVSGTSEDVVQSYLSGALDREGRNHVGLQPGFLFAAAGEVEKDIYVKSIVLRDGAGKLVSRLRTWSDFSIEVIVCSAVDMPNTAFELHFLSPSEDILANVSSDQDLARPLTLKAGQNRFKIDVRRFPLSAGACFIRAGVALRHTRWFDVQQVPLEIAGNDVYASGSVPRMERKPVALEFDWSGPVSNEAKH
jgi:lipopolysaccharide transport system ATP-binding protein